MNKIPCNVIRDLLVLYEDNVCSEESRQMIETHIAECEECRTLYEKTMEELPELAVAPKTLLDEQWEIISKAFKKLQHRLTMRHLIFAGILVILVIAGLLFWTYGLDERLGAVPTKDVKLTELYELDNGNIFCTLETKKPFITTSVTLLQTPPKYEEQNYDNGWYEVFLRYPVLFEKWENSTILHDEIHLILPPESTRVTENGNTVTHTCDTIYFSGRNEDKIVLWNKEQPLKPAPKELEEKIAEHKAENLPANAFPLDEQDIEVLYPAQLEESEE